MKKLLAVSTLAGMAIMGQTAFADVRLRAGAASTDYSVSFDGTAYNGRTAASSYTATNIGISFISDAGVYLDVVGSAGEGEHDLFKRETSVPQDFSRDDLTLTLGFTNRTNGGNALSFFLGYKQGKTELSAPRGVYFAAPLNTNIWWNKDTFESQGLFLGMGFGFPALGGSIGLNGAIAFMEGTWSDDAGLSSSADYTTGFSFGGSYTYMFTSWLGIQADAKYQSYAYDFGVYSTASSSYTIDEEITSVGANVLFQF